jgi:hypothetical protein
VASEYVWPEAQDEQLLISSSSDYKHGVYVVDRRIPRQEDGTRKAWSERYYAGY